MLLLLVLLPLMLVMFHRSIECSRYYISISKVALMILDIKLAQSPVPTTLPQPLTYTDTYKNYNHHNYRSISSILAKSQKIILNYLFIAKKKCDSRQALSPLHLFFSVRQAQQSLAEAGLPRPMRSPSADQMRF